MAFYTHDDHLNWGFILANLLKFFKAIKYCIGKLLLLDNNVLTSSSVVKVVSVNYLLV